MDLLSYFRVFALRCAACQMPVAPQPVTHSAVLACEWKGRSGEEGGVRGERGCWADEWEGRQWKGIALRCAVCQMPNTP